MCIILTDAFSLVPEKQLKRKFPWPSSILALHVEPIWPAGGSRPPEMRWGLSVWAGPGEISDLSDQSDPPVAGFDAFTFVTLRKWHWWAQRPSGSVLPGPGVGSGTESNLRSGCFLLFSAMLEGHPWEKQSTEQGREPHVLNTWKREAGVALMKSGVGWGTHWGTAQSAQPAWGWAVQTSSLQIWPVRF